MFRPFLTQIRAAVLAILGILTGFGILPAGAEQVVAENADAIISGILGLWAVIAFFNGRDRSQAEES